MNDTVEVDANEVIGIYERRLSKAIRDNVILEAQCNQLVAQMAASANDKMRIQQLETRIEELLALGRKRTDDTTESLPVLEAESALSGTVITTGAANGNPHS